MKQRESEFFRKETRSSTFDELKKKNENDMSNVAAYIKKNNNPRGIRDGLFLAHLSLYPKFSTFVAFYTSAVESIYKRLSEGNETADTVAFPLLFLMRHTLELGYKYSLSHLCSLNSTKFDPANEEKHSLCKLHERLRTEYDNAIENGFLPDDDKDVFDEYYVLTAASMKRFDQLERSSTRTRFPNIDETTSFCPNEPTNLLLVKNEFDDAMILLTTMADVIGH